MFVAGVALTITALPALAEEAQPKFYVLGSLGQLRMNVGQSELDAASVSVGNPAPSTTQTTATSWKIGVGYQFNQNFGVEGTYTDTFKKLAYGYINPAPGPATGVNFNPAVYGLFGVGTLPLMQGFSVFAKAGAAVTKIQSDVVEVQSYTTTKYKTNLGWGLGAQYDINRQWAIRAEYENFGKAGEAPNFAANTGTGTGTLSMISASVLLRF